MTEKNFTKEGKGISKIRDFLMEPKIVMMATALEKIPFSVCPMTIQQVDAQGDLWFFSAKDSDHFKDIERDNRVELIYSDESNKIYISIYGNATHVIDFQKVNELWNDRLNDWFESKKDSNIALMNMNIESAYYWDSSARKLVSFFANNSANENLPDDSKKGHINLNNH